MVSMCLRSFSTFTIAEAGTWYLRTLLYKSSHSADVWEELPENEIKGPALIGLAEGTESHVPQHVGRVFAFPRN
jgi:hypothetical protein